MRQKRNNKCSCGSEKKYKKCCGLKARLYFTGFPELLPKDTRLAIKDKMQKERVKILCFGLFGCGKIVKNNSCECGNKIHKEFTFKEEFIRECGILSSAKVFKIAYENIFNRHAGILDIEHYRKKHLRINITDQKEKEILKDPYLDRFSKPES